jgi:hypothetical protein
VRQGFDKLSPNGVWLSPNGAWPSTTLRPVQGERGKEPFALSLSKGWCEVRQGFDKLSPNGVWLSPNGVWLNPNGVWPSTTLRRAQGERGKEPFALSLSKGLSASTRC